MARKLPRRMHYKHGRYYYVHKNKWTPLSTQFHEALEQYGRLIEPPKGGMAEVVDDFMAAIKGEVAASTYKTYAIAAERIKRVLQEFAPGDVKPKHVAEIMEHYRATPAMANTMRNVMKQVFSRAVIAGKCDVNPVQFVPPRATAKRSRYLTDAEYFAIQAKATPTLAAIMDVCYLTGQRIGDVLAIRLQEIEDDGIRFEQQKTGNRLKVAMTPDLQAAISRAKALHTSVRGLTLFHGRGGKPFAYWTIRTLWERATLAAGVDDAHLHDLRAKAATDAKSQGLDSKTLLGHATETAHARYLRSKEIPVATPVKLRQSKT